MKLDPVISIFQVFGFCFFHPGNWYFYYLKIIKLLLYFLNIFWMSVIFS